MADDKRLDLRRAIDENARLSDLSQLAKGGIRQVKVLDENALLEMIQRAVDEAITSQTSEERSRILADSRKQLSKLMSERDQEVSRARLAEAGHAELVQRIEKLQQELALRREVEDQESALKLKSGELASENAYLRENNDKMVEELDRLSTEKARLKEEIERLRAELDALRQELVDARGAGATAASAVKHELDRSRERAQHLEQQLAEKEAAAKEAERLREELTGMRRRKVEAEEGNQDLEESAKRSLLEIRKARDEAEARAEASVKEAERLKSELDLQRLRAETAEAALATGILEEVVPEEPEGPMPIVVLPGTDPEKPSRPPLPPGFKPGKGLDVGTVNLVSAEPSLREDVVEIRQQRNVFIDVEITSYTKAMLTRLQVPYVVQGKRMYILGDPAFNLANVLNRRTRRPMKDGLISPREQEALPIMKLLIGSVLREPRVPEEVCFYSVPGDPIDQDLSVAYHRDLFDAVLKSLGYKPSHILEGHAVTFAELAEENFTGIGISCGGGMFNVCVAYRSMPALSFSTARSGDWVDINAGQAVDLKPEKIAQIKEKGIDLLSPKGREEDAIAIYYRNLVKYNLTNIAERFRASENMPTFNDPISIVFSGGTALAGGFIELVKQEFGKLDFPIPVKEVRLAKDALNATAKGALVAAQLEMASSKPAA